MLCAGAIWKGDFSVADVEELKNLDASQIHDAKEVLMPKNGEKSSDSVSQMNQSRLTGEDQVFRTSAFARDLPERGEGRRGASQGEADGSDPAEQQSTEFHGTRDYFGSISGCYICRHHVQPRVKLDVPKERSFPIPPQGY